MKNTVDKFTNWDYIKNVINKCLMQNKKRESCIDDKSESIALLFSSIMAATAMIRVSADASDITVFPAGIPFLNN